MNTHKEPKYKVGDRVQTTIEWAKKNRVYTQGVVQTTGVHPLTGEHEYYVEGGRWRESSLELAPLEPKEEKEYQEYKEAEEKRIHDIEHDYVRPKEEMPLNDFAYGEPRDLSDMQQHGDLEPTPPSQIEEESQTQRSLREMYELGKEHGRTLALKDMEIEKLIKETEELL